MMLLCAAFPVSYPGRASRAAATVSCLDDSNLAPRSDCFLNHSSNTELENVQLGQLCPGEVPAALVTDAVAV
jgi:hypothetical protein